MGSSHCAARMRPVTCGGVLRSRMVFMNLSCRSRDTCGRSVRAVIVVFTQRAFCELLPSRRKCDKKANEKRETQI
jgi:hypothetical protein